MTETVEEGLMADLDVVEREAREAREDAARLRADLADAYAQIQEIADAVLDADCGLPPLVDAVRGLTAHRNELRARVACLEAALRGVIPYAEADAESLDPGHSCGPQEACDGDCASFTYAIRAVGAAKDALSGGTSALDAAVSAAVAEERNRWATDAKTRVVFLHGERGDGAERRALRDRRCVMGATAKVVASLREEIARLSAENKRLQSELDVAAFDVRQHAQQIEDAWKAISLPVRGWVSIAEVIENLRESRAEDRAANDALRKRLAQAREHGTALLSAIGATEGGAP